jgi:putative peptidoglycan lipid II flippase
VFLLYRLKEKIGPFGFTESVKCGIKSLVAATAMGVVVYLLDSILAGSTGGGTISELIALLISARVGALIYFVIIYLFRIDEVDWVIRVVKDRLRKVVATRD